MSDVGVASGFLVEQMARDPDNGNQGGIRIEIGMGEVDRSKPSSSN